LVLNLNHKVVSIAKHKTGELLCELCDTMTQRKSFFLISVAKKSAKKLAVLSKLSKRKNCSPDGLVFLPDNDSYITWGREDVEHESQSFSTENGKSRQNTIYSRSETIRLWSSSSDSIILNEGGRSQFSMHPSPAFKKTGSGPFITVEGMKCRLWQVQEGTMGSPIELPHYSKLALKRNEIVWSEDSSQVCYTSNDGNIVLLDTSGKILHVVARKDPFSASKYMMPLKLFNKEATIVYKNNLGKEDEQIFIRNFTSNQHTESEILTPSRETVFIVDIGYQNSEFTRFYDFEKKMKWLASGIGTRNIRFYSIAKSHTGSSKYSFPSIHTSVNDLAYNIDIDQIIIGAGAFYRTLHPLTVLDNLSVKNVT